MQVRHKRCDETKPACTKCTKCTETGRMCDFVQLPPFYKPLPPGKPFNLRPNYALTLTSNVSIDGQLLDYFLKVCCVDFFGFFGDEVWDRILPQHTTIEPSVRYAAVALGIMHRSIAFEGGIITESKRVQAMANYAKAVSSLNPTLTKNPGSRDLACLASLLFTMIEVCRGNDRSSIIHLSAGLKMVDDASKGGPRYSSHSIMYELRSVFSRLENQAASFTVYSPSTALTLPIIPSELSSLVECRNVLDAIVALMHSYLTPHGQAYKYVPYVSLPALVAHQVDEVRDLLNIWHGKFEVYMKVRRLKHTQRDQAAATVLKISHLTTSIFLDTYFNLYQTSYDAYLPLFKTLVELTTSAIAYAAKTQLHSGRRLAFDKATVQPLQFVARKCRDRTLRRRAIEISGIAGREGVWDGKSMNAVLQWIIAKEEESLVPTQEEVNLGLAKFGDEVPEERDRIHDVGVDFDRLGRHCLINTSRRRDDGDWNGSWEELRRSVPWGAQQIEKGERVDLVSAFLR